MFGDWRFVSKWSLVPLRSKLDFLTSGSRGWAEYYRDNGGRFLRIQNVKHDELDLSDLAFVEAPTTAEARRTRVKSGDVLLSITADLGRTAVVPDDIGEAYINQHLAILRSSKLNPRFLSAALASPAGQAEILKKNREGVKAGLNFDDVRSIRISDAPLDVQHAFSRRMSGVDKLTVLIPRPIGRSSTHCSFRFRASCIQRGTRRSKSSGGAEWPGSRMSQFAFLSAEFPEVFAHASKAESLALSDARAACFYARLALEVAVAWLYKRDSSLRNPYETTLAARIHEATFKVLVGTRW